VAGLGEGGPPGEACDNADLIGGVRSIESSPLDPAHGAGSGATNGTCRLLAAYFLACSPRRSEGSWSASPTEWDRGGVRQPWPETEDDLIHLQEELARDAEAALATSPWELSGTPIIGGCFVAFARGLSGRGHPGDEAWAAAVAWRPGASPVRHEEPYRRPDAMLRGTNANGPRRASDILDQAVVAGRVPASYTPGLLALRQGPILAAAVTELGLVPDVLLVDATGLDHPRRAGLAVHLGAVLGVPTVGVTHRPLVAVGEFPLPVRGAVSPLYLEDRIVGCWVCTRTRVRPVVAHAGWRTDADVAGSVVLLASTGAARTPVPLEEARRVAREARSSSTP